MTQKRLRSCREYSFDVSSQPSGAENVGNSFRGHVQNAGYGKRDGQQDQRGGADQHLLKQQAVLRGADVRQPDLSQIFSA